MIILGIDPGTATTGFGIIEKQKNGSWLPIDFGVITTEKNIPDHERLRVLAQDLEVLVQRHRPVVAGVEKLYFEKNVKTAITVAQARGVVLQTLAKLGVEVREFTPLEVKSTLTGFGKADKKQMQFMVKHTFRLRATPKPDDAADALAIALCCALRKNSYKR